MRATTTLVPYFGSNRSLAHRVGELLKDCSWVCVPFAGGCSELRHITARTILVGDLHRHVINLANVLKDDRRGPILIRRLRRLAFHEDTLRDAQRHCRAIEAGEDPCLTMAWAESYFVCAWMGRNGTAGTCGEFRSGLSVRYDAGGGDSAGRYRSAVESLRDWRKIVPRCTFVVRDCFELLDTVKDVDGHGVYADAPFPDAGAGYRHNPGPPGSDAERAFHVKLAERLSGFAHCRVVARFYDHELVRELYPPARWTWHTLTGGKTQTNASAPEVLLTRGGQG